MPNRVCCYLTSDDSFYCNMVLTSIVMLRQHNKDIKVRVFLIGSKNKTDLDVFADRLGIEIIRRPPTEAAKEQNYFCLNRQHLAECDEDSVLYIDGDTFIFGDVEKLFDKYDNVDFAAALDDYILQSSDWNEQNLKDCYKVFGPGYSHVFNGGLTLWNNQCIKGWANEFLADVCKRLQNKEFPITDWLFGNNRNCYHKETFAICFYVASKGLKYAIMDNKDVTNLFSWDAFNAWDSKDFIVYHVFTQNWKQFAKRLRAKKKFSNFKVISKGKKTLIDRTK